MNTSSLRSDFRGPSAVCGERARLRNVSDKGAVIERFTSIIGLSRR